MYSRPPSLLKNLECQKNLMHCRSSRNSIFGFSFALQIDQIQIQKQILRYDRYKTQIHSQKYTATAFSDSPILCRVANWPGLYRAQAALWHAADSIGVYNKFSIMQQCNRCCNSPIKPTAPWFDCFSPFPIVFDNQRWTKLQALRCRKGANNVTCFWRTDAIGSTNSK